VPPRHNFVVELKDLNVVPNIAERLKIPTKTDKRLRPNKNGWCEFHQEFDHPIRNCLALVHQLDELVKNGFLKDYLVESQGAQNLTAPGEDQGHKMPVHGEIHTILGGFLRWRVHRFSAEEVCTSDDFSRGAKGISDS